MGLVKYYTLCGACFAELDTFSVFEAYFEIFRGTRLAMLKTICVPDTLSLKPGSGATEGALDYWVIVRTAGPDYIHWLDY